MRDRVERIEFCRELLEARSVTMHPTKPVEYNKVPNDEIGFHFVIKEDGIIASAVSLIKSGEDEVQLRKMFTREKYRGRGYANALIELAVEVCEELNVDMWCDSRAYASKMYIKTGGKVVSEEYLKHDISHVKVRWELKKED